MAAYYFIAQLPSLDGIGENMMPPITEERFLELCHRFLPPKALRDLDRLTLLPPRVAEPSDSSLLNAWNEGERDLRLALGKARAEKLKKPFDTENRSFPPDLVKAVGAAIASDSPLEAEKLLNQYRLAFLESLRPMDNFSQDFVYYYGLKLKLILRIRQFDASIGEAAYRTIYSSIVNGDRLEAMA